MEISKNKMIGPNDIYFSVDEKKSNLMNANQLQIKWSDSMMAVFGALSFAMSDACVCASTRIRLPVTSNLAS